MACFSGNRRDSNVFQFGGWRIFSENLKKKHKNPFKIGGDIALYKKKYSRLENLLLILKLAINERCVLITDWAIKVDQQKLRHGSDHILSGKRVQWTNKSCATLRAANVILITDSVPSRFLSYSGPFNQEFRSNLTNNWLAELLRRKIPVSMNLNITDQLTDTATVHKCSLWK